MNPEFAELVVVSPQILRRLSADACASARKRMNLNLHASYDEPCQRFFNAMEPDSYLRPHRSLAVPKRKLLVGIRGSFSLLLFECGGRVADVVTFCGGVATGNAAVEVPAGVWNTVLASEPGSILLEVKAGPFEPATVAEFAPWAPAEGDPQARGYLEELRNHCKSRA